MKRGKAYVDRLDARKLLDFSLFKTSFEFLMGKTDSYLIVHRPCGNI